MRTSKVGLTFQSLDFTARSYFKFKKLEIAEFAVRTFRNLVTLKLKKVE